MNVTITKLSTTRELAEALSVSPRKVQYMAERGDIPSIRVGGNRRFNIPRILAQLEQASEEGPK